ncbi:hypothetical protein Agub_g5294 [Astrephomene gubernaculifera]|uniref:F-box domain-containing protein n=1 Tax=Astrephomene gubernaculifera TaxID=47775 RepID=A0AAD3DLM7_9CHLO|nr:hypothetical protein Agub_g5294 [Astrephomene gubernaculifera]
MTRILELPPSILSCHVLNDLAAEDRKSFRNACTYARLTVNADVQLVRLSGNHIYTGGQRLSLQRLAADFKHLECIVLVDSPRENICGPILDRFLALTNGQDGIVEPGVQIQSLDVKQCNFISASELKRLLTACPRLERLRTPRWLDRGHLGTIQPLGNQLVELDLGDSTTDVLSLTDNMLANLPALPSLRALNLKRCIAVTDAGVAHLSAARLPSLTSLDLSQTRVNGTSGFAGLQLGTLSVQGCRAFAEHGLAAVCSQQAGSLRSLQLCGTAVQPYGRSLWHVAQATRLEYLDLGQVWEVDDTGLAALSCCPLVELRLGNFNLRHSRTPPASPSRAHLQHASAASATSASSFSPTSSFTSSSSGGGGGCITFPSLTRLSLGGMFAQVGLHLLLPRGLPRLARLELCGLSTARDEVLRLLLGGGRGGGGRRSDSRRSSGGSDSSSGGGAGSGGGGRGCVAESLQELRLVSGGPELTSAYILSLAALPALHRLTLVACPSAATQHTVRQLREAVWQAGGRLQVEVSPGKQAAAAVAGTVAA